MSVCSALLVDPVRPPSENGVAGHPRGLSDQLRTEQFEDLLWCDTRGTRADPVTEGGIGRELVLSATDCQVSYDHGAVKLSVEKKRKTAPSSQHGNVTRR